MYLTSECSARNKSRRFGDVGEQAASSEKKRERILCSEENRPQRVAEHLQPNTATSRKLTYVKFSAHYMEFLHTNTLSLFFYLDYKKAVDITFKKAVLDNSFVCICCEFQNMS